MTWLIVTQACGTPDPVTPEAATLPEPTVRVAKLPPTPADWTALLNIASSISEHWAANTIRQKPPRTRFAIHDDAVDKVRTLILRKQREVPMPVDDDTAHWLVETEDADTAEVVVLDYTVDWTPPPPGTELPGLSYTAVAVEIQAVAGIERYTWTQDGALWVKRDAARP